MDSLLCPRDAELCRSEDDTSSRAKAHGCWQEPAVPHRSTPGIDVLEGACLFDANYSSLPLTHKMHLTQCTAQKQAAKDKQEQLQSLAHPVNDEERNAFAETFADVSAPNTCFNR